jgi:hypothetical protein
VAFCVACPNGTYSTFTGATFSSTCLACPAGAASCPFNALPSCGSSPDCAPSVLLRGGAALNTSYWKNTANLPTLGSDGAFSFDRASSQFLDGGARTFHMDTAGFTLTATFQFTGTAGNYERLIDFSSGATLDNIGVMRDGTNAAIFTYLKVGSSNAVNMAIPETAATAQGAKNCVTLTISSSSIFAYYVNGNLISNWNGSGATTRTLTKTLIGRTWDGAHSFNGVIYHLAAYDRSLSASDILLQHQCAASCTACPIGYFCPVSSAVWFTCMSGQHCPSVGVTAVACPNGTYSNFTSASSSSICLAYLAGNYSPEYSATGICPSATTSHD